MVLADGDRVDAHLVGQDGLLDGGADGLGVGDDLAAVVARQVAEGVYAELDCSLL